jgi:Fe-S-cluster containining protein
VDVKNSIKKSICTNCGYCCDGSMFPAIMLTRDTETGLDSEGNELKHLEGKTFIAKDRKTGKDCIYMKLGCSKLKDKLCTIYEERPLTCRKFVCKLLKNYENGNKTYEECMEIIEKKIFYEFQ